CPPNPGSPPAGGEEKRMKPRDVLRHERKGEPTNGGGRRRRLFLETQEAAQKKKKREIVKNQQIARNQDRDRVAEKEEGGETGAEICPSAACANFPNHDGRRGIDGKEKDRDGVDERKAERRAASSEHPKQAGPQRGVVVPARL